MCVWVWWNKNLDKHPVGNSHASSLWWRMSLMPLRERVHDVHRRHSPSCAIQHIAPQGDKQGCAYKPPCGMWATLLCRGMHLRWTDDYCAYFSTGLLFLFSLSPWGERVLNSTWWKLSRLGVGNSFTEELLRQITSTTRSMRVDATGGGILFLWIRIGLIYLMVCVCVFRQKTI